MEALPEFPLDEFRSPQPTGPSAMRLGYARAVDYRLIASLLGPLALIGCSVGAPSISPFGVPVDLDNGSVLIKIAFDGEESVQASVDTMSPFTIVDRTTVGEPAPEPSRLLLTMDVLSTGVGEPEVTRARFPGAEILDLHPCELAGETVTGPCSIGLEPDLREIRGIVGADLLSRHAVRFDFAGSHMTFFPDIAGSTAERGELCEAVVPNPFQGGGTAVIGGAEISLSGRRITLDACFFYDTCDGQGGPGCDEVCGVANPIGPAQGVNGTFVLSTGLGISIVDRSTYQQYVGLYQENGDPSPPPDYETLPESTLHLPSGPVSVRLGAMNRLALVAESSDQRGPCGERYANDYLTRRGLCDEPGALACPCADNDTFCRAAAVAELSVADNGTGHTGFPVAVVADSDPTLQALRNELRPDLPEVSGILGTDAMRALSLDVDYPNNRLMLRCADAENCLIRPQILSQSSREKTLSCVPDLLGCAAP